MRLPKITITGEAFPHSGGTPVDVPEFFTITRDGSGTHIMDITQSIANTAITSYTLPATGGGAFVSARVYSAAFSNAQLAILGYNIQPNQARNILSGVVVAKSITSQIAWQVFPGITQITKGAATVNPSDAPDLYGIPAGDFTSFVDSWGQPNLMVPPDGSYTVQQQNDDNLVWLQYMSSEFSPFVFTQAAVSFWNNDTYEFKVPVTPTYTTTSPQGVTYSVNRWSDANAASATSALVFGDVVERGGTLEGKVTVQMDTSRDVPEPDKKVEMSTGGQKIIDACTVTMNATPVSNLQQVKKWQFVQTVPWEPAAGAGSFIMTKLLPFDVVLSGPMHDAFIRYVYFKGGIDFRLQLQSNVFQNGSLMVCWAPLVDLHEVATLYLGDMQAAQILPHVQMFAGMTQTIEFSVPWVHFRQYLDLRKAGDYNFMGVLFAMVMNPLVIGEDALTTRASLSLFVSFPCSDFQIINPTKVSIVPQGNTMVSSRVWNVTNSAIEGTIDADGGSDEFKGEVQASGAPMDKPNFGVNPPPNLLRKYTYLSNFKNVTYSQVLDAYADNVPKVTAKLTGKGDDEMSFKYLFSRKTFYSTWSFGADVGIGGEVARVDLCPCSEFFYLPFGSTTTLSHLSYVTLPFSMWRGGLAFRIEVVASPMHTGRLQICSHIGFEANGLSVQEAFAQYTAVLEIGGVTSIDIVVPWRSPTDWKLVPAGAYPDASPYSMGQFTLRVLMPLQLPTGTGNRVYINIYYGGHRDFEVAHLGGNLRDVYVEAPYTS
jgi:hypothetical protein